MGYSTSYKLTIEHVSGAEFMPSCNHKKNKEAKFCPVCGLPVQQVAIIDSIWDEKVDNDSATLKEMDEWDDARWYEHQEDMRRVSARYPGFLFTLHGEGEENEDIWNEYYLGGKMQVEKAQVVIAPFNKSKLE